MTTSNKHSFGLARTQFRYEFLFEQPALKILLEMIVYFMNGNLVHHSVLISKVSVNIWHMYCIYILYCYCPNRL